MADFKKDFLINHEDIDLLAAAAYAWANDSNPAKDVNDPAYAKFNLNGDAEISFGIGPGNSLDHHDSDVLIRDILATQYGDANLDGRVFLDDLVTLALNFRDSGPRGWADGNFDGSQGSPRVFIGDLIALALHWRFIDSSGTERVFIDGNGAIEVEHSPEPVSWLVWAFGIYCVYGFKRDRREQ
jgi:hypothetical protein